MKHVGGKVIYEVQHLCGFGPYGSEFFESLSGARKFFNTKIREIKKKKDYIRRTLKKQTKGLMDGWVESVTWQVEREMNNENGHEFWEEDQYLEIREIELKP